MSCNIDFSEGKFTFNYPGYGKVNITINTAILYENFKTRIRSITQLHPQLSQLSALNFRAANEEINYGDCNKDKTPLGDLNGLKVFPRVTTEGIKFSGDEVKEISKLIADEYENQGLIIRQLFSRDKKGDSSVTERWKGLRFRCTFDSGLGLQNFLPVDMFTKVESFGKYIDPSSSRESDEFFPPIRVPLTISEAAFQELGYTDCLLTSATAIRRDTYAYDMKLGSFQLNHNGSGNDKYKDPNGIDGIFVGNAKKKGISAAERARKIAAILGKSLGDKLMTFLTYVDYILNVENDIICISTCDEIVLLLCMILELPCLFSNIETGDKLRLNKVLYYNPDNVSVQKATDRFEKEKAIVLKGYSDLITIVTEIRYGGYGGLYISMTGDNKKFKIKPEFYDGIIRDLNYFGTLISGMVVHLTDSIDKINGEVANVQRYTVNSIFKINKPNPGSDIKYSLLSTTSKYSVAASRYEKITGQPKSVSWSFSFIAKMYLSEQPIVYGGSKKMKGGVPPEVPPEVDFDQTPMVFYYKDENEEKIFEGDAYEQLKSDIKEIHTQYRETFPYDDIYSETLTALCSDGNGIYERANYNPANIQRIIYYLFSEKMAVHQEEIRTMAEIEAVRNQQKQQEEHLQLPPPEQQQFQQRQQVNADALLAQQLGMNVLPPPQKKGPPKIIRRIFPNEPSFTNETSEIGKRKTDGITNSDEMESNYNQTVFSSQPKNPELLEKVRDAKNLSYYFENENTEPNLFNFTNKRIRANGGKKNKKTLTKQTKKYNKQTKKKRNYPKNVRKNSKTIKQKNNKTQKNKSNK